MKIDTFQTTDAIISELLGRGGFDAWWDSIEQDNQLHIKNAIRDIISPDRCHCSRCMSENPGFDAEMSVLRHFIRMKGQLTGEE